MTTVQTSAEPEKRWGVWCEFPDGRRYWMGDSSMCRWTRADAVRIAEYLSAPGPGRDEGHYEARPLRSTKRPVDKRVFGVWIDGDGGMLRPHWLPNEARTDDWTGTEEEASRRAKEVGGAAVEKSFVDPVDICELFAATVRAATECVSLRRLSGTCLLCGRVDDRLKPDPCPDACPGRALRDAVEALPSDAT